MVLINPKIEKKYTKFHQPSAETITQKVKHISRLLLLLACSIPEIKNNISMDKDKQPTALRMQSTTKIPKFF
jgi:hypothetical protein